jgi:hypothetical protein
LRAAAAGHSFVAATIIGSSRPLHHTHLHASVLTVRNRAWRHMAAAAVAATAAGSTAIFWLAVLLICGGEEGMRRG